MNHTWFVTLLIYTFGKTAAFSSTASTSQVVYTPVHMLNNIAVDSRCVSSPGAAHRPRAWWVLKKRRPVDLTLLLCSLAQESPLNAGAKQLAATTRRRLAMMHTPRGARRGRQHPSWKEREAERRAEVRMGGVRPVNIRLNGACWFGLCQISNSNKLQPQKLRSRHVNNTTTGQINTATVQKTQKKSPPQKTVWASACLL